MISESEYMLLKATQANERDLEAHYDAEVADRNETIRHLTLALSVEKAKSAGLEAQLDAMIRENPLSKLIAFGKFIFDDGSPKNFLRLIFEQKFDETMRKDGIRDPARYRRN